MSSPSAVTVTLAQMLERAAPVTIGQRGVGPDFAVTLGDLVGGVAPGHPAVHAAARPAGTPTGITGPTVRPLPGVVGSGYGSRVHPVHGDVRFHHGVDIAAPVGTPIRAFADGVVATAGWQRGYGNIVVIDHGGGITTRYAHQDTISVPVGHRVDAGDVVGTVGQTGTATGPHLHFELRRDGASIDPAPWLR